MSEVQALVECPVIVGTAGHVDHGKSALIEALTGKNPDRLEVERRRGMTVELGFGELALPSGKIVGLVDVPGHAHYLRAMVQGATGIDVAVLVVSAVEGVMPQTREHVHVLELLGVTHMVVALTMCDLADAEMTELAELDVDDFLSGTVFAGAPIVPVSSKTGEGIDGLLAVLDEQVSACWDACRARAERTDAAPRLPIDRCFTIKGVGTVVTGTLHDAPVAVGDELMALPSRTVCRVRGIQVHGDTPRALPGQRVALNLVGDGVAALDRGEMLGVADRFGQTLRFMMTFTYLGGEGTKPARARVGRACACDGRHGRGRRPYHAFGGRGPHGGGRDPYRAGALGGPAAAVCRRPCRGAVVFARYAHWRRACAAFALPSLARAFGGGAHAACSA